MSCTFWNMRRRKRAAELANQQEVAKEQPKTVEEIKKPKKGVKKDGK